MLTDTPDDVRILRDEVERSAGPVLKSELKKNLRAAEGWKPRRFSAAVEQATQSGAIHAWPKGRLWMRSPREAMEEAVLNAAQRAATDEATLIRSAAVASVPQKQMKETLARLVEEQRIRRVAGVFGSKSVLYYRAGTVEPFVNVLAAHIPEWKDSYRPAAAAPDLADQIVAKLKQRPSGVPVSARDLRAEVPAAKQDFDRAVLDLVAGQKVYVTTHDHGWALPEADREVLIHDGGRNLYVAVTLRD